MRTMPDNCVDSIVTDPPYELGFMGKSWDSTGIAYSVELWTQALRVLKPGGHLLAFSGSRTYHRMACAIEDAGFEIRDQIMWLYGSGFPKSHNVSKGIDKAAGATPAAQQWEGWGTALKPAHEPIVLARKPFIGTVANNVLQHGTGALNIDGSRVTFGDESDNRVGTDFVSNNGDASNNANDNQVPNKHYVQMYKADGRWPANVIHDGSDEVVDGFPDNGSAARFFYCAKANKRDRNEGLDGFTGKQVGAKGNGLARTCATCGASVLDGCQCPDRTFINPTRANHHPTVKPVDLMRYLVKLITPPEGVVLDPFMGSGSTGKGAIIEGFNFVGIEQDADYLDIARARIQWAGEQAVQLGIDD
jgi:site-specific DNA-methyltransferase (adenine-specific)